MKYNTHIYKQVGELGIDLDLYCPEGGSENTPVIVLLHGGCLMLGERLNYKPDDRQKHFFQLGATVISVNYRLAPETKLPQIIEDVQDAFRWIHSTGKELYGYDTSRVVVAGHSAGGYLTQMCGFCLENKPQALVSYFGYGDVSGDWYSQPDPFYRAMDELLTEEEFKNYKPGPETTAGYEGRGTDNLYFYYRQNGLWTKEVGGVDPMIDPDFYKPYNPIENISSDYPPVLFLHGEKDTDVPCSQSVEMSATLTKNGVKNELIIIKDGTHGFDRNVEDPQVQEATARVKNFICDVFRT
jgi:acetyl esterase/lipase